MSQILYPRSTLFSNWVNVGAASAHLCIDSADATDATYIRANKPVGSGTALGLLDIASAPQAGTISFKVTYRNRASGAVGTIGFLQIGSLADGIVKSQAYAYNGNTYFGHTVTLSGAEAASITDWGNLAWRFTWSSTDAAQFRVTQYEATLPDPILGGAKRWWPGWGKH